MANSCGLKELVFLRPLSDLDELVASQPFESVDRDAVYDCYVTFLRPDAVFAGSARLVTKRGMSRFSG
jgi:uncharacterized protein (DUF1697 family)